MENKTQTFKKMVIQLEATVTANPEIRESFPVAEDLITVCNTVIKTITDIKTQIRNQMSAQQYPNISNEKIKEYLGVNRNELESAIQQNDLIDDFNHILDVAKKITTHQHNKASFFSEKRKLMGKSLNELKTAEKNFKEAYNTMEQFISSLNTKIRTLRVKQGDVTALKAIEVSLLLGKDENCYIKVDNVELYEDRAVRDTVGGYNGFSFRVAKGVSYRIGGFSARGESHMEKRLIDKGIFYITDKRYIFDGSTKNIEGELKKVISVEAYSDGIKISRANKRDEVFAGDMDSEYIGAAISALVKNINSECVKNSKQASEVTLPTDNETEQIRTLLGQVKYQGQFLTKNEKQELLERWQSSVKSNREKIAQWCNDPDLNGFIIGVQYTAICDDRSCDFCRKHNGDVLKINDSRIKDNTPPLHLGCRCSWVAVTKIENEKEEIKFQWSDVEKPDFSLVTF